MLEQIMNLQILLYVMAIAGSVGAAGMLATESYLQKKSQKHRK